jgi:hypothetical protein
MDVALFTYLFRSLGMLHFMQSRFQNSDKREYCNEVSEATAPWQVGYREYTLCTAAVVVIEYEQWSKSGAVV